MGVGHLGITLEQLLSLPNIVPISLKNLKTSNHYRFVIYFQTIGVSDMQLLNQYIDWGHFAITVDHCLVVPCIKTNELLNHFNQNSYLFVAHHTIFFKDFDIAYIRGVIEEMQPWCKGKTDITKSLMYKEPRFSTRGLPADVAKLGIKTAADLEHVKGLLKEMDRKAVVVCIN